MPCRLQTELPQLRGASPTKFLTLSKRRLTARQSWVFVEFLPELDVNWTSSSQVAPLWHLRGHGAWSHGAVPLGCWLSSDDNCQPRQCEEASQKEILAIRRTSRIGPAERHLLRSDW